MVKTVEIQRCSLKDIDTIADCKYRLFHSRFGYSACEAGSSCGHKVKATAHIFDEINLPTNTEVKEG